MEIHLRTLILLVLSLAGSIGVPVAVSQWASPGEMGVVQGLPTPTPVPLRGLAVVESGLAHTLLPPTPDPAGEENAHVRAVRVEVATNGANLNIRRGAGLTFPILGSAPQGMRLTVTGVSGDGQWLRIQLPDYAAPAWVYAPLTHLSEGDLAGLPVVRGGGQE
jgi:uncharacterized protein YgiM (DUF1202 family)